MAKRSLQQYVAAVATLIFATSVWNARAQTADEQEHLAIPDPAELSDRQAADAYERLKSGMAAGYKLAELPLIADYQSWTRRNTAPYLSAIHGQRYLNNYTNGKGAAYGSLGEGQRYPPGMVIAKDSFTMPGEGGAFPGALFVMEKLEEGKSPDTANWRYLVVNPDGSLAGDSLGDAPRQVDYCHACHKSMADRDHVYLVPEKYRIAK